MGIEPRERHSSAYRAAKDLIQVQVWTCGTEHGTRSSRSSIRDADAELRAVSRSTQTALTRSSPGRSGSRTDVQASAKNQQWCVDHVARGCEITPSAGGKQERTTTRSRASTARVASVHLTTTHGYPPPPVVSATVCSAPSRSTSCRSTSSRTWYPRSSSQSLDTCKQNTTSLQLPIR